MAAGASSAVGAHPNKQVSGPKAFKTSQASSYNSTAERKCDSCKYWVPQSQCKNFRCNACGTYNVSSSRNTRRVPGRERPVERSNNIIAVSLI